MNTALDIIYATASIVTIILGAIKITEFLHNIKSNRQTTEAKPDNKKRINLVSGAMPVAFVSSIIVVLYSLALPLIRPDVLITTSNMFAYIFPLAYSLVFIAYFILSVGIQRHDDALVIIYSILKNKHAHMTFLCFFD